MLRLVFDQFWLSSAREILASHIPDFKFSNADGCIDQPTGSLANIDSANTLRSSLSADTNGYYTLQLTASNDAHETSTNTVTITINSNLSPTQTALTFNAHIRPLLNSGAATNCVICHTASTGGAAGIPVYYDNDSGGFTVYENVKQRINFSNAQYSRLLRKPTGHHHNGGTALTDPGNINILVNCILEGARKN